MKSKKNRRVGMRSTTAEETEMQPAEEANVSPSAASGTSSATASHDDAEMENEDAPSLSMILKELREVGKEVRDFRKDTKQQLEDIRGELNKTNARLEDVETRVAGHEDKLQHTDELIAEMITVQEKLQFKLTSLEAYSRRESLRIYGIPEGAETDSQSMIHFVEKLLRENLNIPLSMALQIQRAHRALPLPPPEGSQPRSILVKFLCFNVKEEVLSLAWRMRGFMWSNKRINLDHDYPPEILAMRKEYAEARRVLKEKNVRFRTLYPARLKVFFEEGVKTYNTVEEATADLASRGLPVKVITPPATSREKLQRWSWQHTGGQRQQQKRGAAGYKERLQVYRREEK